MGPKRLRPPLPCTLKEPNPWKMHANYRISQHPACPPPVSTSQHGPHKSTKNLMIHATAPWTDSSPKRTLQFHKSLANHIPQPPNNCKSSFLNKCITSSAVTDEISLLQMSYLPLKKARLYQSHLFHKLPSTSIEEEKASLGRKSKKEMPERGLRNTPAPAREQADDQQ